MKKKKTLAENPKQESLGDNKGKERICPKCEGKGWYFVDEWIGTLQGRRDCSCG